MRKRKEMMNYKSDFISYDSIIYEHHTLKMEIDPLSDEQLMDECANLLVDYDSKEVTEALSTYIKTGKVKKEDREKLEVFYRLVYGEFFWAT